MREAVRIAVLVVVVVALAAGAVSVDDVLHGDWSRDEVLVDLVVGVLLAASAMVAALTIVRLTASHEAHRRRGEMLDAIRDVGGEGEALGLLSVLAHQVGGMFEIEHASVYIRDPHDARAYVSVAAHGTAERSASETDEGPIADAVATRKPVFDGRPEPSDQVRQLAAPVIWGAHVRGVLLVEARPERPLRADELGVIANLVALSEHALEHAAARAQLERAAQAGVEALAAAVDVRDNYTADHSDEVVALARRVGERIGLDSRALRDLEFAARLHDVGKIAVPNDILRKPGKLDPHEWDVMRQHTVWGAELLVRVPELAAVAPAVRFSHERWDGGGYPDGIAGDDIPLASRIVSACDAYHAMTSDRPYRAALGVEAARRELTVNAGSQFDPLVVDAVIQEVAS
jgi:hypothetical protein